MASALQNMVFLPMSHGTRTRPGVDLYGRCILPEYLGPLGLVSTEALRGSI